MLDFRQIKTRLKNSLGQKIDSCIMSANFESVLDKHVKTRNTIAVIPGDDLGESPDSTGLVISIVFTTVNIILGIRDDSDVLGDNVQDSLKTYRELIADSLQGFTPTGGDQPLHFLSGRILSFENNMIWQQDTYSTSYTVRGQKIA